MSVVCMHGLSCQATSCKGSSLFKFLFLEDVFCVRVRECMSRMVITWNVCDCQLFCVLFGQSFELIF